MQVLPERHNRQDTTDESISQKSGVGNQEKEVSRLNVNDKPHSATCILYRASGIQHPVSLSLQPHKQLLNKTY